MAGPESCRARPSSTDVAINACWILTATGRPREAVLEGKLNPFPPSVYFGFLGNAYRLAGRSDEAIAALETFHARAPENGVRDLVVVYERAGRREEARGAAARLLAAQPSFTVSAWIDSQFRSDATEFEADIAAPGQPGCRSSRVPRSDSVTSCSTTVTRRSPTGRGLHRCWTARVGLRAIAADVGSWRQFAVDRASRHGDF
jgi:tetratricopeptide (TPR) repeat protein